MNYLVNMDCTWEMSWLSNQNSKRRRDCFLVAPLVALMRCYAHIINWIQVRKLLKVNLMLYHDSRSRPISWWMVINPLTILQMLEMLEMRQGDCYVSLLLYFGPWGHFVPELLIAKRQTTPDLLSFVFEPQWIPLLHPRFITISRFSHCRSLHILLYPLLNRLL